MDDEAAERWEIDQDEHGNPLVRHRHRSMAVLAWLSKDAADARVARCPECSEIFALPSGPDPAAH